MKAIVIPEQKINNQWFGIPHPIEGSDLQFAEVDIDFAVRKARKWAQQHGVRTRVRRKESGEIVAEFEPLSEQEIQSRLEAGW